MQEEAHVVLAMQHASLNRTSQLGMLHATFLQILSTLFQVTLGVCVCSLEFLSFLQGPEADAVMQSVFAAAGAQARSLQPEARRDAQSFVLRRTETALFVP